MTAGGHPDEREPPVGSRSIFWLPPDDPVRVLAPEDLEHALSLIRRDATNVVFV